MEHKCGKAIPLNRGKTSWAHCLKSIDTDCKHCRCHNHGGSCAEHRRRWSPKANRALLHYIEESSLQEI